MTYKETLEKVLAIHDHAVYDASIANEVDFIFESTGGKDRDDFEQLCDLVSEAYLKVECSTSLSQVAEALKSLIDSGKDIKKITRHDIIFAIQY